MSYFIIFLLYLLRVYEIIFIVYFLLSFFPVNRTNFIVKMIDSVCEPVYYFVLKFLPRIVIGFLDLSPIYIFILFIIIRFLLSRLLFVL